MSQVVQDPLEEGRDALRRRDWAEGYELLLSADESTELDPEDVMLLGEAAMWTGHMDAVEPHFERAYRGYLQAGKTLRAAFVATWLAHNLKNNLQMSLANGWMSRAKRLLDLEEEAAEHGYWALQKSLDALNGGDFAEALQLASRAEELGRRFGDRNLEIRGLQRQGSALIAQGEVAEGKLLLDEASAAALAGELDPYSTLTVYCNTIGACRDVADFESAGEWTDRAMDFCEANTAAAFPGMCRVNHAEVMKFKGRLSEAQELADSAGQELRIWNPRVAGAAFYELGEVRLRLGELAQAEQAFREADELGRTPEPGLSLLRLVQGNVKSALASIRRAVGSYSPFPARPGAPASRGGRHRRRGGRAGGGRRLCGTARLDRGLLRDVCAQGLGGVRARPGGARPGRRRRRIPRVPAGAHDLGRDRGHLRRRARARAARPLAACQRRRGRRPLGAAGGRRTLRAPRRRP